LLNSRSQAQEEERYQAHQNELRDIQEQYSKTISLLESEKLSLKEQLSAEVQNVNKFEEKLAF
jgi:hypothetical protein